MKHEQQDVRYTTLKVSSPAFGHKENIPAIYTCEEKILTHRWTLKGLHWKLKAWCLSWMTRMQHMAPLYIG